MTDQKIRVSAVQFETVDDTSANLLTCLRMIDEAAQNSPHLIVLPEFCNHCAFFTSIDEAQQAALDLNGEFLTAIAEKAKEINSYVKINVSLKQINNKPTLTNLLYSPKGKLAGQADTQVLMWNERDFFSRAKTAGDIVKTPFGSVGMYGSAEGLLMETTRLLVIRGARILLNSLNSFANDESILHIPARAAENNVFVVAACKVGQLFPGKIPVDPAAEQKINQEDLIGTGESQIVSPRGEVLAKAPKTGEAVVFAEIDLDEARPETFLKNRRRGLYKPISRKPNERIYHRAAKTVKVAISLSYNALRNVDASLIVFPELTFFENGTFRDLGRAIQVSAEMVKLIKTFVGGTNKYVVTSMVEETADGISHMGVVINRDGIVFRQPTLHFCDRQPWVSSFGNEIKTIDLPFGRLAVIVGQDTIYPESFRLAAYQNAQMIACPINVQERWETEFGLLERSAENRVSIIAATRPNKALGEYGNSVVTTICDDLPRSAERNGRSFERRINYPLISRSAADDEIFTGLIFPANSEKKIVSGLTETDLVDGRAHWLLRPLN